MLQAETSALFESTVSVGASLAMALSSVSVVVNSLLLRYTFRVPKEVRHYREQC